MGGNGLALHGCIIRPKHNVLNSKEGGISIGFKLQREFKFKKEELWAHGHMNKK